MTGIPRQNPMRGGQLKNGNPSGDLTAIPRCGALTRAGQPCQGPAMSNGRCRMHGGLSTGPTSPEGLARIVAARTVHGGYGTEMQQFRELVREMREDARRLRNERF
jgi:hypothetical protein